MKRGRRLRHRTLTWFAPGLAWCLLSCRGATQINLDIRTNVPCTTTEQWKGVAVYLGKPGVELETAAPILVTTSCDASGHVGSLVVAPSGDNDEVVGIRVVAGLKSHPEDCQKHAYADCIVARRSLHYEPHAALEIEITLAQDCLNLGCDSQHTCLSGACAESRIDKEPLPNVTDAPVRCGDNGVRCGTTGDVCCLSVDTAAQTTNGECMPINQCPVTSIVLNCDDQTDCAELDSADGPGRCMLSYDPANPFITFTPTTVSSSQCLPFGHQFVANIGLALCDRTPCNGTIQCVKSYGGPGPNQLPGYFWCQLTSQQ